MTLILGLLLASVKVVAVSRAGLIAYPYLTGFCSCFAPVKGPGSCLHPQRQELGSHTPPQCHQISPSPDCSHFHPPIHLKTSETLSRTIPKAPKDPPCFHWCSANHFSGDWRSCHIFDKNPQSSLPIEQTIKWSLTHTPPQELGPARLLAIALSTAFLPSCPSPRR